jgi:hypothetical protein
MILIAGWVFLGWVIWREHSYLRSWDDGSVLGEEGPQVVEGTLRRSEGQGAEDESSG